MANLLEKYDKNMVACSFSDETYHYYDIKKAPFKIEGLAWFSKEKEYFRLPKDCQQDVSEAVYWLSSHPAGGQLHFQSNSKTIVIKVQLAASANMTHMTGVGQAGFDLYYKKRNEKNYHFFTSTNYPYGQVEYSIVLYRNDKKEWKDFLIHFPLYMGVKNVWLGLEKDALLKPARKRKKQGKVVVYGTSITQGGCATRPGMAYTNLLSRQLDIEFINLGFSGSGLGEPIMAELMTEINNVSLFILDYDANGGCTGDLEKNMKNFILTLRKKYPIIPILILSKPPFTNYVFLKEEIELRKRLVEFQKNLVLEFKAKHDENIYFLDGNTLYGKDWEECSVDGIHPTDLGFYKMSKTLLPVIKKILK